MTFCTQGWGGARLGLKKMDLRVEVLETDLPAEVDTISCTAEALGNQDVITQRASLLEAGVPSLPVLKFRFKKGCSHLSLAFTATSSKHGHLQQSPQSSTSSSTTSIHEVVGYGLYPVTLYNPGKIKLGELDPSNAAKKTHLIHLTKAQTGVMDLQKMVGKLSFKISFKTGRTFRYKGGGSWVDLDSVKQEFSRPAPLKPDLPELASKEHNLACNISVPGANPTVSVIFHSVATMMPDLTSSDLLCVAYIEELPEARENAIFNDGDGPIRTLPALKPIRLKCPGDGGELILNVANTKEKSLIFRTSCSLAKLVPFQHYNWEYNWRWLPGASGFNPAHSHFGLEANVAVSIVRLPSLSDYQAHEGLEILVNGVTFNRPYDGFDLVLCCQLRDGQGADASTQAGDRKFPDSNIVVVKCSCSDDDMCSEPIISPGYFFFPGFSSEQAHQVDFALYITKHNSCPWWLTESKATAAINLTKATSQVLQKTEHEGGVRWELEDEVITNSSQDVLRVKKANGILRWKSTRVKFLSEESILGISDLPLLRDIEVPDVSRVIDTLSSGSAIINSLPTTGKSSAPSSTFLLQGMMYETAMSKLGHDIMKLRRENELLRKENQDYEKSMLEMEASIIVTAADQMALQFLTKDDLIHRIVELSERLSTEVEARKTFQSKVRQLQNTMIEKNNIELRYFELQEAHVAQQRLIRELQTKVAKYRKCAETCQQQETVIRQLEALLEQDREKWKKNEELAHLRTPVKTPTRQDRMKGNTGRVTNQDLKYEVLKAKKRYQDLEDELAQRLRSGEAHSTTSSYCEGDRMEHLEKKLEEATTREKALMQELKEKAAEREEYEHQVARLKERQSHSLKRLSAEHEASVSHSTRAASWRGRSRDHSAVTSSHSHDTPSAAYHRRSQDPDPSQQHSPSSRRSSKQTSQSLRRSSHSSPEHSSCHSSRHSLQLSSHHPSAENPSRNSSQHPQSSSQSSSQHPQPSSEHSSQHPQSSSQHSSVHSTQHSSARKSSQDSTQDPPVQSSSARKSSRDSSAQRSSAQQSSQRSSQRPSKQQSHKELSTIREHT